MVKVSIAGEMAVVQHYHWSCKDPVLQDALALTLSPLGPSGGDPDPDLTAARLAVEQLGAEILEHGEPVPVPEGVVC